jgi:DNA-binding response OmpR family regulator
MRVFVFADDPEERHILIYVLEHSGLDVLPYSDMQAVLSDWPQNSAELIVFTSDRDGPPMDEMVQIRAGTQVPVLVVANPLTESDEVELLRAGADLVLFRPVSPRLLSMYAKILLRRVENVPSSMLVSLDLGKVVLDPATRTVTVEGSEPQRLTHLEFRLAYVLMTNRNQVVPTEILVERVWGYDGSGDRELVRGLVSRLRRKIEPHPEEPNLIETIQGVGYRFVIA